MSKWGIFNVSVLLNKHGHRLLYFKIEFLTWQIFSGQSFNGNLSSVIFQRNDLKMQRFKVKLICFEVIQYLYIRIKMKVMKLPGNAFVSDWFFFVINIRDYLWNMRQTKHLVVVSRDGFVCSWWCRISGHILPSKKIKQDEIEVWKYKWWVNVLVFLLFTKLNNYPPKLSSQFSLRNCTQLRSETRWS